MKKEYKANIFGDHSEVNNAKKETAGEHEVSEWTNYLLEFFQNHPILLTVQKTLHNLGLN